MHFRKLFMSHFNFSPNEGGVGGILSAVPQAYEYPGVS